MKFYKGLLHFLITLVSTFAFLLGWATLAHSLKPVQPVKQAALAPLDPLPPVGQVNSTSSSDNSGLQLFTQSSRPRMRSQFITRGS